MVEEDSDSDTCLGFKRRISQLCEIESNQQTVQEQHSNSHTLSPGQHSFEIVSSAKEERETERNSPVFASESLNGLLKKAKCTSPGDSEAAIGVQEKQETEEDKLGLGNDVVVKMKSNEGDGVVGESGSRLLGEKGEELKNCEVDFSGNREFVEVKKSASSLLSAREVQMHPAVEDWNPGLATCVSFDEIESKNFFKNKEEQRLVESALESIADAMNHASNVNDFVGKREIVGDTIKIKEEIDNFSWADGTLGTVGIPDTDEMGSVCEGMDKMVECDGEKLDYPTGNGENMKCSLKIEVIDETAVIETTFTSNVGIGIGREKGFVGFAKHSETNGHKTIMKQETDGKKEKRPRRRGKGARQLPGTNGKEKILTHTVEAQNSCTKKGDETKRAYLREEMEALRFVSLEAQRKKWSEVYCGLTPTVAREYDGLINCNQQNHIHFNFDLRQQFGKKEKAPGVLGEDYFQVVDNKIENMNSFNPACGLNGNGEDDHTVVEGDCSEEDDSDADYSSIQRPAFVVTGEPNFDSGPPLDGLEYLRRVRWEAAQIPKVKVAKLERSKLNKEQTVYMPKIPDIAKCPEHLLPLKQWEDAFIADFSELRLTLSRLEGCRSKISAKCQFSSTAHEESSNQLLERIIVEKFDNLTTDVVESYEGVDSSMAEKSSDPQSFSTVDEYIASPSGSSLDSPTLSVILKMDSVARLSMLKKRIKLVENMSTLSRNDCAWLFAMCAAIDTPLDADMCAALRCLLRKSASLRAEKSELDDEVVMLNILGTIMGKYFGQSEY